MRGPAPSLVRRLTLAFVISHAAALTLFIIALWPFLRADDEAQLGPDVAIARIRQDVVLERGRLALRRDAGVLELARRSPGLWFVVRGAAGTLEWGEVPAEARQILESMPAFVKLAELGSVGATGRAGDASVASVDSAAGRVVIAAGGVRPEAVTFGQWLHFLQAERLVLVGAVSALFTLAGAFIAIPIVLRSVRPTVRAAAAVDGRDLQRRLPEESVVNELLPLVRAFNAALDRVAEAFERRRRFIADVAHELRTPLAVLNMHVEELPGSAKKPDLQRTVFRLGQMVGQMLDAERLVQAGRRRDRIDVVQLARDVAADVAPLAIASGYELSFRTDVERVTIDADAHAIGRAIANLLGNAIAHGGDAGTIEVHVTSSGAIEVSDDGPGVPPEAQERIFEPFHRERWDRDGCGLGLHLVREIMHAHGGTARLVTSGPGATFRLEFDARGDER